MNPIVVVSVVVAGVATFFFHPLIAMLAPPKADVFVTIGVFAVIMAIVGIAITWTDGLGAGR